MKASYPIIISPGKTFLFVTIPDFNINTQGKSITDAINMARDAIQIMGITIEDENQTIPLPSNITSIIPQEEGDIVTLVDVDFDAYRRTISKKAVKKTLSLPSWLNEKAEKAGINFSQVLQEALLFKLNAKN